MKHAKEAALKAGPTLGPDGTLTSREALRLALGKRVRRRETFYSGYRNVQKNSIYGEKFGRKEPKRWWVGIESATAAILDELLIAGDARVVLRAHRRATTAAMQGGTLAEVG